MLDRLFSLLAEPDFQDPDSGLMSFPAYVYVYPPDQEYELREALPRLRKRLTRPNVGVEPLVINVYEAFLAFLDEKTLGGQSLLDRILGVEEEEPEKVDQQLKRHARSEAFAGQLAERFDEFVQEPADLRRSYVFMHGWGSIHPYLRASQFLDLMERHLRGYKLILFYPGEYKEGEFRLFGRLSSNRVYRASCLNELIGA